MSHNGELVAIDLPEDERFVLDRGLVEWGGSARCTEAMAVAMGFDSVPDLFTQARRIKSSLTAPAPLTRPDWTRALLATEVVFASDVLGSGGHWSATTGLPDDETVRILRRLQKRLRAAGAITTPAAPD